MSEELVMVAGLIVAGYLLLAVELLVLPGFGVAGIGGLLCFGLGCVLAFRWFGGGPGSLLVVLVVASVSAILVWIPRSRIGRDVIQRETLAAAHATRATVAIGERGVAESDLRPAGIARFGDRRESVVTEGEYVAGGSPVQVTALEGARVVVEPVAEHQASARSAPTPDNDSAGDAASRTGPEGDA